MKFHIKCHGNQNTRPNKVVRKKQKLVITSAYCGTKEYTLKKKG